MSKRKKEERGLHGRRARRAKAEAAARAAHRPPSSCVLIEGPAPFNPLLRSLGLLSLEAVLVIDKAIECVERVRESDLSGFTGALPELGVIDTEGESVE